MLEALSTIIIGKIAEVIKKMVVYTYKVTFYSHSVK